MNGKVLHVALGKPNSCNYPLGYPVNLLSNIETLKQVEIWVYLLEILVYSVEKIDVP